MSVFVAPFASSLPPVEKSTSTRSPGLRSPSKSADRSWMDTARIPLSTSPESTRTCPFHVARFRPEERLVRPEAGCEARTQYLLQLRSAHVPLFHVGLGQIAHDENLFRERHSDGHVFARDEHGQTRAARHFRLDAKEIKVRQTATGESEDESHREPRAFHRTLRQTRGTTSTRTDPSVRCAHSSVKTIR